MCDMSPELQHLSLELPILVTQRFCDTSTFLKKAAYELRFVKVSPFDFFHIFIDVMQLKTALLIKRSSRKKQIVEVYASNIGRTSYWPRTPLCTFV